MKRIPSLLMIVMIVILNSLAIGCHSVRPPGPPGLPPPPPIPVP